MGERKLTHCVFDTKDNNCTKKKCRFGHGDNNVATNSIPWRYGPTQICRCQQIEDRIPFPCVYDLMYDKLGCTNPNCRFLHATELQTAAAAFKSTDWSATCTTHTENEISKANTNFVKMKSARKHPKYMGDSVAGFLCSVYTNGNLKLLLIRSRHVRGLRLDQRSLGVIKKSYRNVMDKLKSHVNDPANDHTTMDKQLASVMKTSNHTTSVGAGGCRKCHRRR